MPLKKETKPKDLTATTQEGCEQYWTAPGDSTPQGSSCTATYHPSWKLSKLDESDMPDTTGEAVWCTPMDPFTWTSKGGMTSLILRTAALCRYGDDDDDDYIKLRKRRVG